VTDPKGTMAETALVNYLARVGLQAHRVVKAGKLDKGDVWLPPFVIECKNVKTNSIRKDWAAGLVREWQRQAVQEAENALNAPDWPRMWPCPVPAVVAKPPGIGVGNVGDWSCWFPAKILTGARTPVEADSWWLRVTVVELVEYALPIAVYLG